jgi:predicted nucleotidyltransferase
MQPVVSAYKSEIEAICRRFHVRRLDVFGSAARDDFDPARSGVDFLVEYEKDNPLGGLEAYFGLKEALEALLGRPVDLVMPSAVQNPYMRAEIERSREPLFAA